MAYIKELFQGNNYEGFYFEVRDARGKLQATFSRRYEAEEYATKHQDLMVTKRDQIYNSKENCKHYKGKIWLNGDIGTRGNICADTGREELKVISYVPEITEENILSTIEAMGWRPEQWLGEA